MTDDCHKLDAYLADGLPEEESNLFARHMADCEACSDAVEHQRWIDGLLQSDMRASLEPVPERLISSLRVAPLARKDKNLRRHAAFVAAAAAVVLLAIGASLIPNHDDYSSISTPDNGLASSVHEELPKADQSIAITPGPLEPTFVSNEDVIAVPIESADANVTRPRKYPSIADAFPCAQATGSI